ncbi:uncharacterized protein LOC122263244 [Penaeus japonicus]|uniref:uncharacterized protein LOC122263244 n=1 Tax=Penaeus japonicus TaxID=27405 RepID=UPI001C70D2B8|nr:uncharacterized protein LOC122263244 [Penaeus japonicus]
MMTEIVTHLEAEAEKISNPTGLRRRRATNPYQRARSQKRTDKTVHVANKEPKKADKHETGFNWLIAALLTLLVFVGICNVFLYRRLFYLEDLASNQDVSGGIPDIRYIDKGGSWDDVASILKRQDQMHAKQIRKWSQAIDDASQQLQQVLELLQGIAINIPQHQEKLMAAFIQDSEAHIQDIISEKTSEQGVKVEGTLEQGGKVEGTSEQDILLERASEEDIRVEITSE